MSHGCPDPGQDIHARSLSPGQNRKFHFCRPSTSVVAIGYVIPVGLGGQLLFTGGVVKEQSEVATYNFRLKRTKFLPEEIPGHVFLSAACTDWPPYNCSFYISEYAI